MALSVAAIILAVAIPNAVSGTHQRHVSTQATPTPTPGWPVPDPPPRALLTVGDETQEAGVGTYCWDGFCADIWGGWIAPNEPMRVHSPFVGLLEIVEERVPTTMYMTLHRFESHVGEPHWGGTTFWPAEFARRMGPRYVLPPAQEQDVQLSREPGLYVIGLSVYWEDYGDAHYGFLIEVEEW